MLTVEQLIDQLQAIEDKSSEVVFDEGGAYYELTELVENSKACSVYVVGKKIYG